MLEEELGWVGAVPTALDEQLQAVREATVLDVVVVVLDELLRIHHQAIVDPLLVGVIGGAIAGTHLPKEPKALLPGLWALWHQWSHERVRWFRSLRRQVLRPDLYFFAEPNRAGAVGHALTTDCLKANRQLGLAVEQVRLLLLGDDRVAIGAGQLHGCYLLRHGVLDGFGASSAIRLHVGRLKLAVLANQPVCSPGVHETADLELLVFADLGGRVLAVVKQGLALDLSLERFDEERGGLGLGLGDFLYCP